MIKITALQNKRARRFFPILLGCVLVLGGGRLQAAEGNREPNLSVSAAAGIFRADQSAMRTLYGNGIFNGSFELRARLGAGVWAVAGYRMLKAQGTTAVVGPAIDDESYSLSFKMTTLRGGLRYGHAFGRFVVFGGAGACLNRYEEKWADIPGLGGTGKVASWYAELGGEFLVRRFISLFIRGEYSPVPTGRGSALEHEVNLGGLDFSVGLGFRF